MSNTATAADLGVVERLDEKIRQLISLVEKSRTESTKLRADNERLGKEVDALQAQLSDAAGVATELQAMREERDQVRTRVADMLAQLDALQM
ncbi:cell division protein ZapB [Luteitalea sp.]|jgi:FtsZ-binding cell division protein ZapB|uniref:cell division protein ZapB n=1 Tax=Luteitalea sp. TaxID=2004800 RepID=UPI0025BE95D8|nr:cell division protein ZapB [Luteitalea sp.]